MAFWNKVKKNGYYDDDDNTNEEYEYGEDYEDENEDEFGNEQYSEPEYTEAPIQHAASSSRRQTYPASPKSESASANRVLNIHTTAQLQVVIRKPETMDDAIDIADHLLERHTVVVNLESTNKELGKRIIDFLSGVSYANHGALTKVANATFVVTPYNVGLIGQDVIGELENSGVFF